MTRGDYQLADNVVLSVAAFSRLRQHAERHHRGRNGREVGAMLVLRSAAASCRTRSSRASSPGRTPTRAGSLNAVSIVKVEASKSAPDSDLLSDIVCGTAKTTTSNRDLSQPPTTTVPDRAQKGDRDEHAASRVQNENGTAMVVALLALVVMTILGTLFLAQTKTETQIAGLDQRSNQALMHAEAGYGEVLARMTDPKDSC